MAQAPGGTPATGASGGLTADDQAALDQLSAILKEAQQMYLKTSEITTHGNSEINAARNATVR